MMEINEPGTKKIRSLILAGGGLRVAYQAGVLMALEEEGIVFQHVDGTSGGIFNTAMLASGLKPKEIARRWRSLKLANFISSEKAISYLRPFKMKGFADADNIRAKVFPHLGVNLEKINQNRCVNATFNVCNFSNKSIEAIPNEVVKEDHLIAGVSLPIFMPAIQIGESWYTDAVWIKDANLMEAVHQGAEELWLVWAIGNGPSYLKGAFHQYVHMIEMSASGGLLEEYKQIALIHKNVSQELGKDNYSICPKLYVFKSQIALPLDPDFFLNKINARELINMGYAQAKDYLKNKPLEGERMNSSATENLEPRYIYSFRAVFKGDVEWNSKNQTISYAMFFRYAEFQNHDRLETYASLIFSEGAEIPTFNNRISNTRLKEGNLLKVQSEILINSKIHKIQISTLLTSEWEILFGLSFKQISFRLCDENDKLMLEANLFQSPIERFRSLYYSSLTTIMPKKAGMKKYLTIIKNFIAYGI